MTRPYFFASLFVDGLATLCDEAVTWTKGVDTPNRRPQSHFLLAAYDISGWVALWCIFSLAQAVGASILNKNIPSKHYKRLAVSLS